MDENQPHFADSRHTMQGPHFDLASTAWNVRSKSKLSNTFRALRLREQFSMRGFELAKPVVLVGRHSEADLRLTLDHISRKHCTLFFEDGHWLVQDLGSSNGVFINGERVHRARLFAGDQLSIALLTFVIEGGVPIRPAAETSPRPDLLKSIVEALPND